MKLVTVKNLSDIHLAGVIITPEYEDKNLTRIKVSDAIGNSITIAKNSDYGNVLKIMVEQPFEEEEQYRLYGTLAPGVTVLEYFKDDWEAQERKKTLEYSCSSTDLKVSKETVKIDDHGRVVA